MSVWYVIKVIPGKERLLNDEFNEQIRSGKIKNIKRFICPTEKKYFSYKGKRIQKDVVLYRGYLYFETDKNLSEDELKYVSTFPSIMGMFGNKLPILLTKKDIDRILKYEKLEEYVDSKNLKFVKGERILITEGPFKDFNGEIIKVVGQNVSIEVKIFGRPTPIELNLEQIIKHERI